MVELKYTFNQEAYCKIIFHANKYQSQQVCGLVIGQAYNAKQSKSDSKQKEEQTTTSDKHFKAIDCIPLFHGHILAPFLEAALAEVNILNESEYITLNSSDSLLSGRKILRTERLSNFGCILCK